MGEVRCQVQGLGKMTKPAITRNQPSSGLLGSPHSETSVSEKKRNLATKVETNITAIRVSTVIHSASSIPNSRNGIFATFLVNRLHKAGLCGSKGKSRVSRQAQWTTALFAIRAGRWVNHDHRVGGPLQVLRVLGQPCAMNV